MMILVYILATLIGLILSVALIGPYGVLIVALIAAGVLIARAIAAP